VFAFRLGYQWSGSAGLYVEPAFAVLGFQQNIASLEGLGSVVFQAAFGDHYTIALGPSIAGGGACAKGTCRADSLPSGGFLFRLAGEFLSRSDDPLVRSRGLSFALTLRQYFTSGSLGTEFYTLLSLGLGYEAY
jgi:hypothetical protein